MISVIRGRLNHYSVDNGDVKVPNSEFPVDSNSESVPDPYTTPIKSIDDDKMDHLLEFFHSEYDEDLLDVDLKMLQDLLVVTPPSKFYTVYTVFFNKYGGANVAVANYMSHFSMFLPTKTTVKLANGNTEHTQGIRIILCCFPNCSIMYPVGPVYYYPGHPSNTISLDDLNFLLVFKTLHLNGTA